MSPVFAEDGGDEEVLEDVPAGAGGFGAVVGVGGAGAFAEPVRPSAVSTRTRMCWMWVLVLELVRKGRTRGRRTMRSSTRVMRMGSGALTVRSQDNQEVTRGGWL